MSTADSPINAPPASHYSSPTTGDYTVQDTKHVPGGHVHVVSFKNLLVVYLCLVVLTILTVAVTHVSFGPFNVWVALAIAVAKAALVTMYFMHLRWDSPFNGMILIIALGFVVLFIGAAVTDSGHYKANYTAPTSGQVLGGHFGTVRSGG